MHNKDRDRSPRGAREQIIHLAARLMAEEHIDDFATAKRKAAKRLGLPEGKNLPGNDEIESALREYRQLFNPQHADVLSELRRKATVVMRLFIEFKPYLIGSVLSGLAGPHSDINLVVYTDDAKALEIRCLNLGIDYRVESASIDNPTLAFYEEGSLIRLSVRSENDERQGARGADEPLDRARLAQVERLLLEHSHA
ncbi:hypothetical protein FNU76_12655 [Chitinimonas arctica]|uniref:Nucleotidyltransferase domain-containing protein n=1 Tax=Chitinimonas arctica TaxID=2594795 RepID=A0A516SG56_9NEIS|nr:hypothetical protein [Chitinimonas arctica]QDQ27145.1 hypothetical protein FNU76_12655 [Chitinimonas arctica]